MTTKTLASDASADAAMRAVVRAWDEDFLGGTSRHAYQPMTALRAALLPEEASDGE